MATNRQLATVGVAAAGVVAAALLAGRLRRYALKFLIGRASAEPAAPKWVYAAIKALSPSKPSTFYFEDLLPSLPIPDLKATCDAFIASVRTLISPEELRQLETDLATLISSDGPTIQALLHKRATEEPQGWLSQWWLYAAYLSGRDPIALNSNTCAVDSFDRPPPAPQCMRAAGLVDAAVKFFFRIQRETLPPLRLAGTIPLAMDGYACMFGTTRIPGVSVDSLAYGDYKALGKNAHIIVHRGGLMYRVAVIVDGKSVPQGTVQAALEAIVAAESGHGLGQGVWQGAGLAALTALPRDRWAAARSHLLSLSPDNVESLAVVESALFHITLHEAEEDVATTTATTSFFHALMGDGQHVWYDKSFNVIVFANGRAAINMEHSWSDAGPASHMWEFMLANETYASEGTSTPPASASLRAQDALVQFDIDEGLMAMLGACGPQWSSLTSNVNVCVLLWNTFGKDAIKGFCVSPDAFFQQALQVAGLLYFKRPVLTYESGSTRRFAFGRTECIRSATTSSLAFATQLVAWIAKGTSASPDETAAVAALLRSSAKAHTALTLAAVAARGCDRHLLGVRMLVGSGALQTPAALQAVSHSAVRLPWELSTSAPPILQEYTGAAAARIYPQDKQSCGGGFGPVAPGGVGVAYFIYDNRIHVFISSQLAPERPGAEVFAGHLESALRAMATVLTAPVSASGPPATPVPATPALA